jgi:hypothetical protein
MPNVKRQPPLTGTLENRSVIPSLAGVSFILVLLLMPVGWKFEDPWAGALWNLLHLPGFFFLTRFLIQVLAGFRGRGGGTFAAAALALAAGGATELLQARLGRSASLHDFVLDGFGVLLATTWPPRSRVWSVPRGLAAALTLLGGIAFALAPAWKHGIAVREARDRLPGLGMFDEARLRSLWVPHGREAEWDPGTGAIRVKIPAGTSGGIDYRPRGQDWSGYRELVLAVTNPGEPIRLGVRIDDAGSAADRSWHSDEATVGHGVSEVRISLGKSPERAGKRAIDWTEIHRLVLFVDKNPNPVEFSLRSAVLR